MADGKRVPAGAREPIGNPGANHPRHGAFLTPGYALAPHQAIAFRMLGQVPGVFASRGATPARPLPVRIGFTR